MSFFAAIAPSLISGAFSAFGASSANRAAQSASREQMAFQERMLSTQYQRTMTDMRKAGLNPMLSAKMGGGGGAGGSSYTPINIGQQAGAAVKDAVSSGLALRHQNQQLKNMKVDAANTSADTRLKMEQKRTEVVKQIQQWANTEQMNAATNVTREQVHSAKAEATQAKHSDALRKTPVVGRTLQWINEISRALQGLSGKKR